MYMLKRLLTIVLFSGLGFSVFGMKKKGRRKRKRKSFHQTLTPVKKKKRKFSASPLVSTYKIKNRVKAIKSILNSDDDKKSKASNLLSELNNFYGSLSIDARIKDVRFSMALFQLIFIELHDGNQDLVKVDVIKDKKGYVVGGYVGTFLKTNNVNFIVEFRLKARNEKFTGSTFCFPFKSNRDADCCITSMKIDRKYYNKTKKDNKVLQSEKNSNIKLSYGVIEEENWKHLTEKKKSGGKKSLRVLPEVLSLSTGYDQVRENILPRQILELFQEKEDFDSRKLKALMLKLYNRINKRLRVVRNKEMPLSLRIKNKHYESERFYQLVFACMLKFIWDGVTQVEIPTAEGRTDVVVVAKKIYIIEFKYNVDRKKMNVNGRKKTVYGGVNVALQQIRNKKYCEYFVDKGKEIMMIGVNIVHKKGKLDVEVSDCEKFINKPEKIIGMSDFLKSRLKY